MEITQHDDIVEFSIKMSYTEAKQMYLDIDRVATAGLSEPMTKLWKYLKNITRNMN